MDEAERLFREWAWSALLRRLGTVHVATFPASFHIDHGTLLLFAEAVDVDRRN